MITQTQNQCHINMAQYATTMSNLITPLQNTDGIYSLTNDSTKTYTLSTTATNANTQGYEAARGIMKKVYGNRYLEKIMPKPVVSGGGQRNENQNGLTNNTVRIYPNPSADKLNIDLQLDANQNCVCNIYTMDGKLYFEKPLISGNNILDTQKFLSGIYAIKILTANTILVQDKILIINK